MPKNDEMMLDRMFKDIFGIDYETYEKEGLKISDFEKEEMVEIAIHEAGHFIIKQNINPEYMEIVCVSIIPTKTHKGMNYFIRNPNQEKDEEYYKSMIAFYLGGKMASYASNRTPVAYEQDLVRAYGLANEYVEKYHPNDDMIEEGEEILKVMYEAKQFARKILNKDEEKLQLIAKALLIGYVLFGDEAQKLYDGVLTIDEFKPLKLN